MPTDDSTRTLVTRTREGDAKAAEELARRHLRAAYSVALAILRDVSDAEDVAQDAFALALEKLDTCREPERFSGWLLRIVRHQALNAAERRRARGPALELSAAAEIGVPGGAEQSALRDRLLSAMSLLSPVEREVVLLHDLEGWTHAEIGSALELSEVMSRQHLFHARQTLRASLDHSPREVLDGS
jgi:RNA polymerase sigma-70 factor (ECF subfamily)